MNAILGQDDRIDRMFYRVKKSQREAKSNLRPEETNPKIHHPVLFSPQTKNPVHPYLILSSRPFLSSNKNPVHPVKNSNPIEIYIPLLLE